MPVAGNTQVYGLLHGGASVVLAETLGSLMAALHAGSDKQVVGIDINATHHRSAEGGTGHRDLPGPARRPDAGRQRDRHHRQCRPANVHQPHHVYDEAITASASPGPAAGTTTATVRMILAP